jgi:glycosyltransferase involved in cell wall biosynthesis
MAPIRLLTFTTLFPNAEQPNHGVFVENRLRHLVASGEVSSTILAPVPYMPDIPGLAAIAGGRGWDRYARVPADETRHGLRVYHPRYPVIPRFGMNVAPALLAWAAERRLRRLIADGLQFDAIDAHYVYPDGVAALRLGKVFGKPVAITARGSDITQLPLYPTPRRMITQTVRNADALIAVSAALGETLVALGAPRQRVHVLRNGIDTTMFQPVDRAAARAHLHQEGLNIPGPLLISVGLLIERKRHDLTIAALAELPGVHLLLIGEGPERAALRALATHLGVADRVSFGGTRAHAELPLYYSAADAMVLASSREGWANVLLEAMACGTPVIVSNIPGNPEVVQTADAGLVVEQNTPAGITNAVRRLLAQPPSRAATRAYAEAFSWDATTAGQIRLFRDLVG